LSTKPLFLLWDADYLIYRVGFAVKDDEPVEYALATVKSSINGVLDKLQPSGWQLYLTGKGNFRDTLGTIQVYKGNRDPANRPFYYQEIKDYLITHQDAFLVNGQEADDAVGIEQWKHKDRSTCIVGQDKDLDGVPGWHYNPVKQEMYYITLAEANYNFWLQVLTGDRTDNIAGLKGVGPKTAEKVLAHCDRAWLSMQEAVENEYKKVYKEDWFRYFHETASLIWIRREEGINYDGRAYEGLPQMQSRATDN
jgi:hypothetical protein